MRCDKCKSGNGDGHHDERRPHWQFRPAVIAATLLSDGLGDFLDLVPALGTLKRPLLLARRIRLNARQHRARAAPRTVRPYDRIRALRCGLKLGHNAPRR